MKNSFIFFAGLFLIFSDPCLLSAQPKGMFIYERYRPNKTDLIKVFPQFAVYFTQDKSMEVPYQDLEYQYEKRVDENGNGYTNMKLQSSDPRFILKDVVASSLLLTESIITKGYLAVDTLHHFNWTIDTAETRNIQGYDCSKASTPFRGRDYIAWFTPDIPVPFGPWKFGGLPGLILEVQDTENLYDYRVLKFDFEKTFNHDSIFKVPEAYQHDNPIDHKTYMQKFAELRERAKKLSGIEEIITAPNGMSGRSTQTVTIGEKQELY